MTQPNLGTTWREAIRSAYAHGFESFDHSNAELIDVARDLKDEMGWRDAAHEMANRGDFQAFISGGQANRELWWAIDDFYAEHATAEEYEQLKREAAVAEDIDSAFEAGAYDAILDREYDPDRVSHLYGE